MTDVNLKNVFEAVGYNIVGGEEHGWQDVFPDGRFIDFEGSFSVVFNCKNQEIYSLEFYNEEAMEHFFWINPKCRLEFNKRMEKFAQMPNSTADFEELESKDPGVVVREYVVKRGLKPKPTYFTTMDIDGVPV